MSDDGDDDVTPPDDGPDPPPDDEPTPNGRRGWWQRWRGILLAFGAGSVTGLLLATLATYGWPEGSDEDLDGDYLVVLSGKDDGLGEQRQRLILTWNALHPQQKARIQVLPASADEQHSEMLSKAQSERPDVDVFNLDVTWTAEFAAAGYIRPLKVPDVSGFLAKPLETCRYEGTLWALPFNTDAGLLFYRPGRMKEAYSQQQWDQEVDPEKFRPSWGAIARESDTVLNADRSQADRLQAGYTGQFGDYEGLTVNAMEAIWEAGGQIVDEDGNIALDSDDARRGLQNLVDGFDNPRTILPAARQQKESDSTTAFGDGQVLFMRNWPVAYRQLKNTGTDKQSPNAIGTDFAVTALPGPSALGGQNLAVAKESRHPEAARELIEFLTSEASQQVLFQDGGLASTRLRTYRDPVINTEYPYASKLLNAVDSAELRPVTAHYWTFSEVFRQVVNEVLDSPDHRVTDDQVNRLQAALKGKETG